MKKALFIITLLFSLFPAILRAQVDFISLDMIRHTHKRQHKDLKSRNIEQLSLLEITLQSKNQLENYNASFQKISQSASTYLDYFHTFKQFKDMTSEVYEVTYQLNAMYRNIIDLNYKLSKTNPVILKMLKEKFIFISDKTLYISSRVKKLFKPGANSPLDIGLIAYEKDKFSKNYHIEDRMSYIQEIREALADIRSSLAMINIYIKSLFGEGYTPTIFDIDREKLYNKALDKFKENTLFLKSK